MNITTTAYRLTQHRIELCSDNITIHHNCTLENQIIIDSVAYNAVYKTGESCEYNDYNYPSNCLELTDSISGTSETLELIYKLTIKDIIGETEQTIETLEELKELSPNIDTIEKLLQVYEAICANAPGSVFDYLDDGHTFSADDYCIGVLDDLYLKNAKKSNKQVLGAKNLSELMIIICKISGKTSLTKKERVKYLTEFLEENKNKININAQDSYGQTALWYADNERREDDAAVTKLLLSYGACANVVDKWGANVLRYCKNAEKINLLSKLIK